MPSKRRVRRRSTRVRFGAGKDTTFLDAASFFLVFRPSIIAHNVDGWYYGSKLIIIYHASFNRAIACGDRHLLSGVTSCDKDRAVANGRHGNPLCGP